MESKKRIEDFEHLFSAEDYKKLISLGNARVNKTATDAIDWMEPSNVVVFGDDEFERCAELAVINGEEFRLKRKGHTCHYESKLDQGRDPFGTRLLRSVPFDMDKIAEEAPTTHVDKASGITLTREQENPPIYNVDGLLSKLQKVRERTTAIKEVMGIMKGVMKGHTMIIAFFCLGPQNSSFSLSAMQITDSFYVAHSEMILYRPGYEQMKNLANKDDFFYFWHSAGELSRKEGEHHLCTVNIPDRRIYIDLEGYRVFSVNNQYAGNSLACKKLALRLAIYKANSPEEGNGSWLTEHMFLSGFEPLKGGRRTYFAGAYPSGCGKTSTAMIPGARLVGDDIIYVRKGPKGEMRGANIEQGIFGIIKDVNAEDDPVIYECLRSERRIIFSNVMIDDELNTYWQGCFSKADVKKGIIKPKKGYNHQGVWKSGPRNELTKKKIIPRCHDNARFTLRITDLDEKSYDTCVHDKEGVEISGILYGGRDSFTSVPILESLDWASGVLMGAGIASEPTAQVISKDAVKSNEEEPVSKQSPMANLDFLTVLPGEYFNNHLKFGKTLAKTPPVFYTNYFLRDPNNKSNHKAFLNEKVDKRVWLLWAEGRVNGEFKDSVVTPLGVIPAFEDLVDLFKAVFSREYTKKMYEEQFSIRVDRYITKFGLVKNMLDSEKNVPEVLTKKLDSWISTMEALKAETKLSIVSPFHFVKK